MPQVVLSYPSLAELKLEVIKKIFIQVNIKVKPVTQ